MWHILGAGAMGSLWAAHLARSMGASRVTMVLRTAAWEEMGKPSQSAVRVEDACRGGKQWSVDIPVEQVHDVTPIRRLLVTTKATDAFSAMTDVSERLTEDAAVVLLCNGMGVLEEMLVCENLARFPYLLGTTTHGAYTKGRLDVVHAGVGRTWVGLPKCSNVSSTLLLNAAAPLKQTALHVSLVEHIEEALWKKLATNASLNGLTALVGCRNGKTIESEHGMKIINNVCTEVSEVMENSGMEFSQTDLVASTIGVARDTALNLSSMYQDILSGHPTEVDYINGYVVRESTRLGLKAPVNDTIHSLVKLKEEFGSP
ncbi:unnamed protein product [Choristocarpus tenellus]